MKGESGREIEGAAKGQLGHRDPRLVEGLRPGRIAADQHPLHLAGALQRRRQAHKKGFRPTVTRPGHRLQQPAGHQRSGLAISASKRAATASQLSPR